MKFFTQTTTSLLALITLQSVTFSVCADNQSSQSDKFKLSSEAEIGSFYNSHLRIDEIDQNNTSGDRANTYKIKLKGELKPTDRLAFAASYRYTNNNYLNADEYDQVLGHLALDASYKFDFAKLAVNHNMIDVQVNQNDLFELERTAYSVGKLFKQKTFLKLSAIQQSKSFKQLTDRDATSDGYSLDTFVFYNNANSHLHFNFEQFDETANLAEFDFSQTQYSVRYSAGFELLAKDNRLDLGWKHTERDYSQQTNQLGRLRNDSRNSLDLKWNFAFNQHFSLVGQIEKTFADSNVSDNDFEKDKASLTIKASF
jgi:hypothetical protein